MLYRVFVSGCVLVDASTAHEAIDKAEQAETLYEEMRYEDAEEFPLDTAWGGLGKSDNV